MDGYKYRCAHFVDFADRYAIEEDLLGKRITFRFEGVRISIIMPSVHTTNGYPELGVSGLKDDYGIGEVEWGKVNSYNHINNLHPLDAWISKVLVECISNDPKKVKASWIAEKSKRVVYALQIINPEAIRVLSDEVPNEMCDIKYSVEFDERGGISTCV